MRCHSERSEESAFWYRIKNITTSSSSFEFRVSSFEFRVSSFEFRVSSFEFPFSPEAPLNHESRNRRNRNPRHHRRHLRRHVRRPQKSNGHARRASQIQLVPG